MEPGELERNLIAAVLDDPAPAADTPPQWEHRQDWRHCSPDLLATGVDCADTPRRTCECFAGGSHDHLVHLASEMSEPGGAP
jgi:hypothetical protein